MLDRQYVVDREIYRLEDIFINGLPEHYQNDFDRYLVDWSYDFTQSRDIVTEFGYLVRSLKWVITAMKIEAKHGYDFAKMVKKAIDCYHASVPEPTRSQWRKRIQGDR